MFAGGSPRANETLRYLGSRLVTTVLIVIGAMLLLFTLSAVVPGDPATTLLGPQATPELSRRFITEMGLDQPLPIRLWRFFANVATGNLGVDVISGRSVAGLIGEVIPYTLILTFSALGLAALIGVPLGIYAATHRGSVLDNVLAFVSVAFIAVPSFVIAIFLLLIFATWLDWLPGAGREPHGRARRRDQADDPADAGAGTRLDRLHRPADPHVHARGDGRTLHPHVARLRPLAAARHLQVCAEERLHSDDHAARPRHRPAAGQRRARRDRLRAARDSGGSSTARSPSATILSCKARRWSSSCCSSP